MNGVNTPLFVAGYIVVIVIFLCLLGCCDTNRNSDILYKGHRWDIIKLNDTTFVVVPGLNGDSEMKPVVINANDVNKFAE